MNGKGISPVTARMEFESDGRFEQDRIILDQPPVLPEGTRVHVHITVKKDTPHAGWPEGFFERTAGQISDSNFERPPQGKYEKRT